MIDERKYTHKSFYLTPHDQEMLKYLAKVYGQNPSAVMRKLIAEAYSIINYVEQGKVR